MQRIDSFANPPPTQQRAPPFPPCRFRAAPTVFSPHLRAPIPADCPHAITSLHLPRLSPGTHPSSRPFDGVVAIVPAPSFQNNQLFCRRSPPLTRAARAIYFGSRCFQFIPLNSPRASIRANREPRHQRNARLTCRTKSQQNTSTLNKFLDSRAVLWL
jgi:hypothetical protein